MLWWLQRQGEERGIPPHFTLFFFKGEEKRMETGRRRFDPQQFLNPSGDNFFVCTRENLLKCWIKRKGIKVYFSILQESKNRTEQITVAPKQREIETNLFSFLLLQSHARFFARAPSSLKYFGPSATERAHIRQLSYSHPSKLQGK